MDRYTKFRDDRAIRSRVIIGMASTPVPARVKAPVAIVSGGRRCPESAGVAGCHSADKASISREGDLVTSAPFSRHSANRSGGRRSVHRASCVHVSGGRRSVCRTPVTVCSSPPFSRQRLNQPGGRDLVIRTSLIWQGARRSGGHHSVQLRTPVCSEGALRSTGRLCIQRASFGPEDASPSGWH